MNAHIQEQIRVAEATAVLEGKRTVHYVVALDAGGLQKYVDRFNPYGRVCAWVSPNSVVTVVKVWGPEYYPAVHDPYGHLSEKRKGTLRALGATIIQP